MSSWNFTQLHQDRNHQSLALPSLSLRPKVYMEILEMIGWVTAGFLPTLGMLELSYQMGRITGKKGERYPRRHIAKPSSLA